MPILENKNYEASFDILWTAVLVKQMQYSHRNNVQLKIPLKRKI